MSSTFQPFKEEHQIFRQQVRAFVDNELRPNVDQWEEEKLFPNSVFKRAGELGILGAHYPEDVGGGGGDFWMSVVKSEELALCGSAGVTMGLLVQADMATPVINDLGSREVKDEFLVPAISGDKVAALGVTEPGAGSDVAGLRTTARAVGDDYVINGSKTFITNGTRADFVTLMVKTDADAGHNGISIIVCPTDVKGFSISKKLEKAGNWSSDTAELFFEDVRVPKRYLLGQEGMGFVYLMQNFQSERLVGCVSGLAGSKLALDRSVQFGRERMAFGHVQRMRGIQRGQVRQPRRALDGNDPNRIDGQGLRWRRHCRNHGPMPAVPRRHGLPGGPMGRPRVARRPPLPHRRRSHRSHAVRGGEDHGILRAGARGDAMCRCRRSRTTRASGPGSRVASPETLPASVPARQLTVVSEAHTLRS
jgi:citronellyl-CoA dehydrogenase